MVYALTFQANGVEFKPRRGQPTVVVNFFLFSFVHISFFLVKSLNAEQVVLSENTLLLTFSYINFCLFTCSNCFRAFL